MGHEKSRKTTMRFRRDDDAALDLITAELRMPNASATVRFLVHEKMRALGLKLPAAAVELEEPPPAAPKRRPATVTRIGKAARKGGR